MGATWYGETGTKDAKIVKTGHLSLRTPSSRGEEDLQYSFTEDTRNCLCTDMFFTNACTRNSSLGVTIVLCCHFLMTWDAIWIIDLQVYSSASCQLHSWWQRPNLVKIFIIIINFHYFRRPKDIEHEVNRKMIGSSVLTVLDSVQKTRQQTPNKVTYAKPLSPNQDLTWLQFWFPQNWNLKPIKNWLIMQQMTG